MVGSASLLAVETNTVLWGQTLIYTAYVLVITLLIGWFAIGVTKGSEARPVPSWVFYSFVGFLAVVGVSLHIVTYNTIPWSETELHRGRFEPTQTFVITVEDHEFALPSEPMNITCGETVMFSVTSNDLTYGFGLFRPDHSMIMQMQVNPGSANDIIWEFEEEGDLTIKSTEYSGPAGTNMTIPDIVHVTCDGSVS
ncbi:MAG: cytochrome c oxidase subunit II [Actinomycetia bacterium]|nr:cytochrome c oxidase subunit II [Actinomycetes bacterium]